ncbi:sigma-54-dependent transcriptional regulator [Nitrospira sp. NS4]|uniref:sigma-54-dependent transcriptional regulator n=1 Tax=Nitrospira sp. NS4 TaxID=3414498 RepID=UPI003C2AE372
MRAKILLVDDDRDILLGLENRITWMGHEPLTAGDGEEALRLIEQESPDLVLLDLELPRRSGLEVLQQVRNASAGPAGSDSDPPSPLYTTPLVIILTAFGTIERAVQAMQLGAFDFLTKPFTADHLTVVIKKALDTLALDRHVDVLRKEVEGHYDPVVSTNPKMAAQLAIAKQAAASPVTVLLLGETGTGKEVIARAIHRWSPRHAKPFVAVNCAALPDNLLENELFGHERGAYTGALKREPGKIEIAEGGTLFLDEIGDMPLLMQSHLLRVLQDQTFYRVGGTQLIRANVRFIAATNKDLHQAIRHGTFREDLYYRLAVITSTLPPLRERLDDLPALAGHFLRRAAALSSHRRYQLSERALGLMRRYQWPGNIRELENVLTRAVILCEGTTIEPDHLSLTAFPSAPSQDSSMDTSNRAYHEIMEAYSRKVLESALQQNGWNQTRAAEALKLQRTYFTKLLRQKQIPGRPPQPPSASDADE